MPITVSLPTFTINTEPTGNGYEVVEHRHWEVTGHVVAQHELFIVHSTKYIVLTPWIYLRVWMEVLFHSFKHST